MQEGFEQSILSTTGKTTDATSPFMHQTEQEMSKSNEDMLDAFYVPFYNKIYRVQDRVKEEVELLMANGQMDAEHSNVLDVGCKTGELVQALMDKGIRHVQGMDNADAFIQYGMAKHPQCSLSCQPDWQRDTLAFERGEFSHILLMDRAMYRLQDRIDFLRKCYHWLQHGGYLVIHVLDPQQFDTILPLAKQLSHVPRAMEEHLSKQRLPTSSIDMIHTQYMSTYDDSELDKGILRQKETFLDQTKSRKIRRQEYEYRGVDDMSIVVQDVQFCRFSPIGQVAYTFDPHQYLLFFQKTF